MDKPNEKIIKFESFLNDTLRANLGRVLAAKEKVFEELAEYLQLTNVIEKLQEGQLEKNNLKTKVDLGCNFYVQAKIPDASRIFVAVGFGFFVEFTLEEALKFIGKKEKQLQERSDKLQEDAVRIKAHIKLVLKGLKELQNIDDTPQSKEFHDVMS